MAFQKAHEHKFADRKHGVLTYYLVDALRAETTHVRPSLLLGRIAAKVQSHCSDQTPCLDGEDSEAFFGLQSQRQTCIARVLTVDAAKSRVTLDHGALQGVHKGAEYSVRSDDGVSVACVTVVESMGLRSEATISNASKAVLPGFRALLSKHAPAQQAGVRLFLRDAVSDDDETHQRWVKTLRDQFSREQTTPLHWKLLSDNDPPESVEFFVKVADRGCYELLDSSMQPISNLPTLPCEDSTSVARLSAYVDHMAKFRLVQRLSADPTSALKAPCRFEVVGKSARPPSQPPLPSSPDDLPGELEFPSGLLPVVQEDGKYKVHDKEVVSVLFENQDKSPVYLTLFDLKPRWGVEKIFPAGGAWAESVEGGVELPLSIQMEIPTSILDEEITETFKAVVMRHSTNLGVWELPDIGEESYRCGATANSSIDEFTTVLDRLIQDFEEEDRHTTLKKRSSGLWQTFDIMVRTVRARDNARLDNPTDHMAL